MSSPPPVVLMQEDGQGNRKAHDLRGPGGEIYISVGDPDCHGAVWKIKGGRKKCDVYVFICSIGGDVKVSWHPESPGSSWWFHWDKQHVKDGQITDRLIDTWSQPPEVGESGWAKGFSMWTRHQDVVPAPDNECLPADILWVPPPPEGYAMGLHVVIARPEDLSQRSASELRWVALKGARPFDGFTLADRRVVLLVVSGGLVTEAVNHMIENALARFESALEGADQARMLLQQSPGVARMLVWASGPDGDKKAWDVAVPLPAGAADQSTE
jgi:hypothetical protein